MKIKKMQALCKKAKCVEIVKDISEEGLKYGKYWPSNGYVLAYMGENSPRLPSDIIYTMDLSEDDRLNITEGTRTMLVPSVDGAEVVEPLDYCITDNDKTFQLFSTSHGLLCIDKRLLDVFEDTKDKVYKLIHSSFPMLAVEACGMSIGYISPFKMPLTDIADFGSRLDTLARAARHNGFCAAAEQISIDEMTNDTEA